MQMESVSLSVDSVCVCVCIVLLLLQCYVPSIWGLFFFLKYLMDLIAEVLPVYGSCVLL